MRSTTLIMPLIQTLYFHYEIELHLFRREATTPTIATINKHCHLNILNVKISNMTYNCLLE